MKLRELRGRRRDDGAAAVEFAFIAPLLIFLLLAIVGYGYMLSFRQAMSQAASEGARAAAVAPAGVPQAAAGGADSISTRAIDAINQGLGGYGVTCTSGGVLERNGTAAGTCVVTFTSACSASSTGATCAKVALDYAYKDNSLLPSFPGLGIVLPSSLAYTAEVELS